MRPIGLFNRGMLITRFSGIFETCSSSPLRRHWISPHAVLIGNSLRPVALAGFPDCPALAFRSHACGGEQGKKNQVAGILLTGGLVPNPKIVELLKKSEIPVLVSKDDTYTIAGKIENLICKIQKTDKDKIAEARQLVKENVDINTILKNL